MPRTDYAPPAPLLIGSTKAHHYRRGHGRPAANDDAPFAATDHDTACSHPGLRLLAMAAVVCQAVVPLLWLGRS